MGSRPPLSVIVAAREGMEDLDPVLEAIRPQAERTGAEVLLVGPIEPSDPGVPAGVRVVTVHDPDIFRLRLVGIREARGEIVAIGEDHAVPRPDWCEAVIRAHGEHPDAPVVVGCLVNGTTRTLGGRGNFLAFASPYQPPMPVVPSSRPPPLSALSLKRSVLEELEGRLGEFEAGLVPRLHADGKMVVADDRIVVDHYQDHGVVWSIVNGFHGARGSYGYLRAQRDWRGRLKDARWAISNWPRVLVGEVRAAAAPGAVGTRELAFVAAYGTAVGLGGAFGALIGPGRSPRRVA